MDNLARMNNEKLKALGSGKLLSPLAKTIKKNTEQYRWYGDESVFEIMDVIKGVFGKHPTQMESVEEFLSPKLHSALKQLVGKEAADDIFAIIRCRMKWQYSNSSSRRSYRSSRFSYHASTICFMLTKWCRLQCYEQSLVELMRVNHESVYGMDDYVALEINRGNKEVIDLIREMILGDNNYLLSRTIIIAVLKSDNRELNELLKQLLLAAKLQEGLRQAILESIDAGTRENFIDFFKCCIDNDLFRFSSAVRAFDTWTGMGFEAENKRAVTKAVQTAYDCLTDPAKREACKGSEDPVTLYLALWALGTEEIDATNKEAESFLSCEKKYKRMMGWYFVYRVENAAYKHNLAIQHLDETDEEMIAYVTDCLYRNYKACNTYPARDESYVIQNYQNPVLSPKAEERRALFMQLKEIALHIGNREWRFSPSLFPWNAAVVNQKNAEVMRCMFSLLAYDRNEELIREMYGLRDIMDPDLRLSFIARILDPKKNPEQRDMLYEFMKDRSSTIKEAIIRKLKLGGVSEEDIAHLCQMLATKSASQKKLVMDLLSGLPEKLREQAVDTLVEEKEYQIQAAIELLLADEKLAGRKADTIAMLREKKLTDQTLVLLNQLMPKEASETLISEENGYGLYHASVCEETEKKLRDRNLKYLSAKEIKKLFPEQKKVIQLFGRLNQVFEDHKDYEYEIINIDNVRSTVLFGRIPEYAWQRKTPVRAEFGNNHMLEWQKKKRLHMIPFHEEFREILNSYTEDAAELLLLYWSMRLKKQTKLKDDTPDEKRMKAFTVFVEPGLYEELEKLFAGRTPMCFEIIELALMERIEMDPETARKVFEICYQLYFSLCHLYGEEYLTDQTEGYFQGQRSPSRMAVIGRHPAFGFLQDLLMRMPMDDACFSRWFGEENHLARVTDFEAISGLRAKDYLRALEQKLIPVDCFYEYLIHCDEERYNQIRPLTTLKSGEGKELLEQYPVLKELMDQFLYNVISFEALRGQSETALTGKVCRINSFEGEELFVKLITGLGSENLYHGYEYLHHGSHDKNSTLSRLLRRCQPAEEDTAESLKKLLKGTDIKEKRLIEVAMYAPQWAGIMEELTGWTGLKKGIWLFHAHVSEHISVDKETEVARYSQVTPEEFKDGAFDIGWFKDCYETLGEKRFKVLYNCAKYTTSGSNSHRRSQIYTDAVTGEFELAALEAEILEKRNQDKLRAYALVPLDEKDDRALLKRYQFLMEFQKGSRQFGALKRESENKAVKVALRNLAVTAGLFDVNRLMWRLEKQKNQEILPMLEKHTVDEYQLWISVDEEGDASLLCEKGGKALKSLPKSLAKDSYAEQCKEVVKDLKEQKKRSRKTLENAMVNETTFAAAEISNILTSLTIAPMARKLLWTDGEKIGFLNTEEQGLCLTDAGGRQQMVAESARLKVAHPYHLITAGAWSDYMHLAFEKKLVQPFRQIFREYYPLTEEEKNQKYFSRRYAGYQVQPKKTASILKQNGWTVDYEEGLQKVCYDAGIVVHMYAYADWFSPSDVEAPALEDISLTKRRSGERVALDEISPVLFSEVMRDMDLVVSVAYVGGVDPETSHSTIEVREALAEELMKLLKLTNVSFTKNRAVISGKLGEYTVHLGSGTVQAEGKGSIPILPVHSQHRGRIFLPFADEDPKTAEILSKIILLAEDNKIKDPSILAMIR